MHGHKHGLSNVQERVHYSRCRVIRDAEELLQLLQARKLSAGQQAQHIPCDVCSSDEARAGETIQPASTYCVQCQQNYSEQCSLHHRKMKNSSNHTR